jgi:mersacidin/lichenicidin family type 2 lantibiotic
MTAVATLVRAWRDEDFFETLSEEAQAQLPASPVGKVQLRLVTTEATKSTLISDTCSTLISDCCSTLISNTCSTLISDCC